MLSPGVAGTMMPPPCTTMADATMGCPPLVPSGTSEASRHVYTRPRAGGPRDVGTGHQQPQHGHVPSATMPPSCCHQGVVTTVLGCVPECTKLL